MNAGLLTVQYLSGKINPSANYLSDMLRTLTGQTTWQHIQNFAIEKAKVLRYLTYKQNLRKYSVYIDV